MSLLEVFRRGMRPLLAVALIAAFAFILPSLVHPSVTRAQVGNPGLLTCSDGSVGFSCAGTGIGYCGGALVGAGQACSGPGVSTSSPGCSGTFCAPSTTTTCPGGVIVALGQSCNGQNNSYCPNGTRAVPGQSCISVTCSNGVQQPANFPCPKPIANQLCDNGQSLPVGQLCPSTPATTSVPVPTAPPGVTVTYAAGWNIVAGPSGTTVTGASGSVYTLQPGDASYETLPSGGTLKPGAGYLADFRRAPRPPCRWSPPPPFRSSYRLVSLS